MATQPIIYTSSTGFTIELKRGLIIDEKVDIILNTTTSDIDLNASPLEDCISSNDLTKIRKECLSKAPLDLVKGEYVVTGGGRDNSYIYHGCVMDGSGKIHIQDYLKFVKECFDAADSMGLKQLAVPVLDMKSFSTNVSKNETQLATYLLNEYISTVANDTDLGKMNFILVVMKNDKLFKIYSDVFSARIQPSVSKRDDSKSSIISGSVSSAPSSPVENRPDDENWEILRMTRSVGTGANGGVKPKQFQRTNSTGSNGKRNLDLNETHTFPSRQGRNDSTRSRPASRDTTYKPGKAESIQRRNSGSLSSSGGAMSSSGNNTYNLPWAVTVYKGDITDVQVDGIVHGTTHIGTYIDLLGPVGKALKHAGGKVFENDCEIGGSSSDQRIAVTGPGKMKYNHVIHVNTTYCKTNVDWKNLIRNCLDRADELKMESLGFPAIGAASLLTDVQAKNFKETFEEYSRVGRKYLKEVHVVIHHDSMLNVYKDVLEGSSAEVFPSRHNKNNKTHDKGRFSQNSTPSAIQGYDMRKQGDLSGNVSFKYKGVQITVKSGDVTDETVDCVVHGFIQTHLGYSEISLIDAIGKALLKKAGREFEKECSRTRMSGGDIKITCGSNAFHKVIHVETFGYSTVNEPSWKTCIRRCLGEAANGRMKSIAFPPLGTYLYDTDKIIQMQFIGLKEFVDMDPGSVKDIRFVVFNDTKILNTFKEAAKTLQRNGGAPNYTGAGSGPNSKISGSIQASRHSLLKRVMHKDKGVELEIIYGDLSKERVDGIVNVTTANLDFIGKAGEAIQKAGGTSLQAVLYKAYFNGKSVVCTHAGDLPCKKVLHLDLFACKTTSKETKSQKTERMQQLIYECLVAANTEKLHSLAFPAIGTGNTGCDAKDIAERFKQAILKFCVMSRKPVLKEVRIIIFNPSIVQDFVDILKK